ncbi:MULTISPECIES: M20 metallopeptidase family protein [Terrisporobacter]|uniref:Amidohydrolase n=1 Tax=Terrisporobacter muris TaxID=2963284 RepID=A0A9X2MC64_9FIRM|nr:MULTISPECIES: amidohydrolase [Terrisporobacter]MCR1823107.1 amidohydrolase [Terrisporobacter muris]MDY3374127.1 amidohydrolase [Terrisporobacter othiniensis]
MHACGHDGHTASLLGAAMILSELKDKLHGNIKFMFQPDEEIESGAKPMIDEGILENPHVDAAFGGHLWGGVKEGMVGVKHGPMMASPDIFNIKIIGKGGHAGVPQSSIDPIPILSQVISTLQTVVSRKNNPFTPLVLSCCHVKAGNTDCHNAIPTEALLGGTVRAFDEEART